MSQSREMSVTIVEKGQNPENTPDMPYIQAYPLTLPGRPVPHRKAGQVDALLLVNLKLGLGAIVDPNQNLLSAFGFEASPQQSNKEAALLTAVEELKATELNDLCVVVLEVFWH